VETISKKQRKAQHYQFTCKRRKRRKTQEKIEKFSLPTNKEDKTRELRKLIGTINLCHPGRNVAEQLYCSLHVKELKVTTTEHEGQTGD